MREVLTKEFSQSFVQNFWIWWRFSIWTCGENKPQLWVSISLRSCMWFFWNGHSLGWYSERSILHWTWVLVWHLNTVWPWTVKFCGIWLSHLRLEGKTWTTGGLWEGGGNTLMWPSDSGCSPLIPTQCYYLWWTTVNRAGSKQGFQAQCSAVGGMEADGHTSQWLFNQNSPLHRQWGQQSVSDHSGNVMLSCFGRRRTILLHTLHWSSLRILYLGGA